MWCFIISIFSSGGDFSVKYFTYVKISDANVWKYHLSAYYNIWTYAGLFMHNSDKRKVIQQVFSWYLRPRMGLLLRPHCIVTSVLHLHCHTPKSLIWARKNLLIHVSKDFKYFLCSEASHPCLTDDYLKALTQAGVRAVRGAVLAELALVSCKWTDTYANESSCGNKGKLWIYFCLWKTCDTIKCVKK